MSGQSSIELIRDEEKELVYYKDYLQGLATQTPKGSDIFSNKGEAHASILMANLLTYGTKEKLDMYCTGLRPGILCGRVDRDGYGFRGAYWKVFKRFFLDSIKSDKFCDGSIRILIQTEEYLENAPFRVVGNALRDPVTENKIKVRKITEKSKKHIEEILGVPEKGSDTNYNFAIFDGQAFRLEYEANSYRALGSFNSESWTEILSSMFNEAFKEAEKQDITLKVRGLRPYEEETIDAKEDVHEKSEMGLSSHSQEIVDSKDES